MQRHFTTSVFITDSQNRVLLLWHKRLQRWMPPGGHIDENETPEECAARECKEETGLDIEILSLEQPDLFAGAEHEGNMLKRPFAILLENIPASEERDEPEHQHMDFIFRGKPIDETQPLLMEEAEMEELRWFTRGEIDEIPKEKMFENVTEYIRMFFQSMDR